TLPVAAGPPWPPHRYRGTGAGGSRGERPGVRYRPRRRRPTHARHRCRRRAGAERSGTGRSAAAGTDTPGAHVAGPGRDGRYRHPRGGGRRLRGPREGRPVAGLAWEKPSPGMGSAKEPEELQLLSHQTRAEDACEPGASFPGCLPAGECLPGSSCAAEGRAMRTCCAVEPESQSTVAGLTVEKKMPSPTGPAPGTLLPDTSTEPSVVAAMGSCGGSSGTAPACSPTGMGDPSIQKENTAPVPSLPEPCLKAPSKDAGSVPAPAKHVAFVEPTASAGAAELPSQEQPQHGTGTGRSEAGQSPTTLAQGRAEGSPAQDTDAGSSQQPRTAKLLCESYSFEVSPPQDTGTQDMGTQVDSRASLVSVALSPMSPPDGAAAFAFPKRELGSAAPLDLEPSKKDAEMQVSMPVETRSVATGPMTPVAKSPQASYPEVHVKGTVAEENPEPIREVSWDEKGMTWEVYGASMEVEVLGMAIQKHLEKQIEEHGRQVVMTPQSTRTGSVKGAPRKGEAKRQPSVFRALLQNVRRPRCCSRTGPAME
ncbi:GRIN1 protein, partial [Podargus strigoides]|nr:GRIN1 protein [Podargus strigoides]